MVMFLVVIESWYMCSRIYDAFCIYVLLPKTCSADIPELGAVSGCLPQEQPWCRDSETAASSNSCSSSSSTLSVQSARSFTGSHAAQALALPVSLSLLLSCHSVSHVLSWCTVWKPGLGYPSSIFCCYSAAKLFVCGKAA